MKALIFLVASLATNAALAGTCDITAAQDVAVKQLLKTADFLKLAGDKVEDVRITNGKKSAAGEYHFFVSLKRDDGVDAQTMLGSYVVDSNCSIKNDESIISESQEL